MNSTNHTTDSDTIGNTNDIPNSDSSMYVFNYYTQSYPNDIHTLWQSLTSLRGKSTISILQSIEIYVQKLLGLPVYLLKNVIFWRYINHNNRFSL